jgi:penicillin-binding protein 1C
MNVLRAFVVAVLCFEIIALGSAVVAPLNIVPYKSTVVVDRDSVVLTAFLSTDSKWRFPQPINQTSPFLQQAFVAKEDAFFWMHPGVNPVSMARALWHNVWTGTRTSGASTITMQVVRLLQQNPRTVWHKTMETILAVQLELRCSKRQILELYCSLVSYGGNVEGVSAASWLYYNKWPYQLTIAEVTALVVVPNKPTTLRLSNTNPHIVRSRNKWLRRFYHEGLITQQQCNDALAEPLSITRVTTPRNAWHLSQRLHASMPAEAILVTTIDGEVQQRVHDLAIQHQRRIQPLGIGSASVIVVENSTGNVVAYVGNPDIHAPGAEGYVDGVTAVRSPGSTLKPLVYGLALDAGIVTPKKMLLDIPVMFDGYAPENFDKRFSGMVPMEQALATSLNIPAVQTLHELGMQPLLRALQRVGFRSVTTNASTLGLSAVLGGCGVTLEELTTLYTGIANGGEVRKLQYVPTQRRSAKQQILSASASYIITESMLLVARPDVPTFSEYVKDIPLVAWKTGTSYGRRDAWSIGSSARYTVGVWCGNMNGKGSANLTGATIASPLLFAIVRAIDGSTHSESRDGSPLTLLQWHARPPELGSRFVCSISGLPPADSCTDVILDDVIPGVSKSERCNHRREYLVNAQRTMRFCSYCVPQTGFVRRWYTNVPPAVLAFYRSENRTILPPPPHNDRCTHVATDGELLITAPVANKHYIIEQHVEPRLQLRCTTPTDATTVFWYVNDVFVCSAPATGYAFVSPKQGHNTVQCVDSQGRSQTISFDVSLW